MIEKQFEDIVKLIQEARFNAIKAVNVELINLYWNVGAYISKKINAAKWGDKTVDELAEFIQANNPELKGFNRRGLYRMKQFYETYASAVFMLTAMTEIQEIDNQYIAIVSAAGAQLHKDEKFVSTAWTQTNIRQTILVKLSWSHHRTIFSRCRSSEEMEFYIKLSVKENYSSRELDRQISSALFERVMMGNKQLSPVLKELHPNIFNNFKDSYVFEFLNLPEQHSEDDLQKGFIRQMKQFILELGRDFIFIGEEYKMQVGNRDFYIDLLFFHRSLQCLVAFELKKEKFEPEHLGKINFYLEALDRDVRKQNENPSIGVLLCKDKDSEVVEYALSRSLSPTMIAEYKTQLPDKKLLQQKLHELFKNSIAP